MSSIRHFCVWDTETTGLDPDKGHEIVQIGAKALNYFDLADHHAGEFTVLIKPQHPELADPEALAVIGPLFDRAMKEGLDQKTALRAYLDWVQKLNHQNKVMSKPVLVGQHTKFDVKHIVAALKKNGMWTSEDDLPWASNLHIDLQQWAFGFFESDPNVENFRLDTMNRVMNIKGRKDKTHDALEDVRLEAEHLRRYMTFNRKCRKMMIIK